MHETIPLSYRDAIDLVDLLETARALAVQRCDALHGTGCANSPAADRARAELARVTRLHEALKAACR